MNERFMEEYISDGSLLMEVIFKFELDMYGRIKLVCGYSQ